MDPLRILITNWTLVGLGGTQVYARDLALGLLRRGHRPALFSPEPGTLRLEGIPVTDDLDAVPEPHVIHGQHHLPAMEAFLRFPGVPGLYLVHDRRAWLDDPPVFPRIRRYAAVDQACRERIPGEARVIYNSVDLNRFRPRGPLPARPRRALLFASGSAGDGHVGPIRAACRAADLPLDIVGVDDSVDAPERILGNYDLVFGKARCALEAMAVGAAVILCSGEGAGPMVSAREFDRLRPLNFGFRTLTRPLTSLAGEIARYDAADAAEVSRRVRAEAGFEGMLDDWIALYREILEERVEPDPRAEGRAAAAYVRSLNRMRTEVERTRGEMAAIRRGIPYRLGRAMKRLLRRS